MQHPVHVTTHCYGLPKHCNIWPTYDTLYRLATRSTPPPPVNPTCCQKLGYQTTNHNNLSTTQLTPASCNDHPAAFNDSTDLSFPQQSSRCIQRLDRPQLPATIIQLHSTTDLSFPQRSSSWIQQPDQSQLTHIKHLAVSLRLDLRQLPSSNVQLRTSTTRPYQLSTSPI